MKKHIYDSEGVKLIRIEEAIPGCSDYCDACGSCLKCYGEDECLKSNSGEHFWVQYGE